ncbi:MAG TPA: iron-containing redox enzyme family protein [Candidatus Binatia bacterium]
MSIEHRSAVTETAERVRALISTPDLDVRARRDSCIAGALQSDLAHESERAWSVPDDVADDRTERARACVQRALYELNRLELYWFDDPGRYVNENSVTLARLHEALETPWQRWLLQRVPSDAVADDDPPEAIRTRAERDATPSDTADQRFFAEEIDLGGYRRLLEIASVNGLVEASQLSRALGGAPSPVQSTLTRIFLEEYGNGLPKKKHSTFFARMLEDQGMDATPEAYLDSVPWQVLGAINHAFTLAERKQLYLRFCGAFTFTEVSTPASFQGYARAAARLGLSDGHDDYWALHIREDRRHGAWMVEQVVQPLCERFPERRHELLLGYEQQRLVEGLAGAATARECRAATRAGAPS